MAVVAELDDPHNLARFIVHTLKGRESTEVLCVPHQVDIADCSCDCL